MSLSANISLAIAAKETKNGDIQSGSSSVNYSKVLQLLNGTGAGQANKMFSDQRTLAASASETLDLDGSLLDAFGVAIAFSSIKAVVFVASESNLDNIAIGGGANPFLSFVGDASDELILPPGGLIVLAAPGDGFSVTASTADGLDVTNLDAVNAATYDVILIGVAA